MKGVICEIKGRECTALFTDGKFRKIPTPENALTGTVVSVSWNRRKFIAIACLGLAVLALILSASFLYFRAAGFIDITYGSPDDVEVIVEFSYNRFGRILNIRAFSPDAAQSLKSLNPSSRNLEEGFSDIVTAAAHLPSKKNGGAVPLSLRVSDGDSARAGEIREKLLGLKSALERKAGRKLSLRIDLYHLGLAK